MGNRGRSSRQNFWNKFVNWWTAQRVAFLMLLLAVVVGVTGYINQHIITIIPSSVVGDFYANIAAELASIAITVLVIDNLNEHRSIKQEKDTLILQMSSPTNSIAREAVRVLRMKGWLVDGTLKGANLSRANLEKAFLERANLRETRLYKVNFRDAYLQRSSLEGATLLQDIQLAKAKYLRLAVLPHGKRYDGRYNLRGDLHWAIFSKKIDPTNNQAMAEFYDVSLDDYLEGQKWARANLTMIRKKGEEVASENHLLEDLLLADLDEGDEQSNNAVQLTPLARP